MTMSHQITRWQESPVDRSKEHMELRYGQVRDGGWDDWLPAALIGPPVGGVVNVEILVDRLSPENAETIAAVLREIQFHLIDKCRIPRPEDFDPWEYAIYHCGTTSNAYSSVHWSYFPPGMLGRRP
jgi:hypothetical protein